MLLKTPGHCMLHCEFPHVVHACIVVVLFNQGLVEKQLFITDERVTLNKYISNQKITTRATGPMQLPASKGSPNYS